MTALTIIFWILPFLQGMYFEYCGSFMTAVLLILLIVRQRKGKGITLSLSFGMLTALLFFACAVLTCLYAVDRGIAVTGICKFLWPLLFLLLWQNEEKEQRQKLWQQLPYIGAALCLLGWIAYPIPVLRDYFFVNSRLSSGFGYANTLALYLLLGIVVTLEKDRLTCRNYILLTILLAGIVSTGSRTVFVLTALVVLYYFIHRRDKRFSLYVAILVGLLALAFLFLAGRFSLLERLRSLSLNESTFVGRLLYARDALGLLLKHPFGMGHMGYYYMENMIQTGVYSVQYVHQDLLQIALDFGVLPALAYLAVCIRVLLGKGCRRGKKLMLLLILAHGLLDFDLAYSVILCLVYMLLDEERSQKGFLRDRELSGWVLTASSAVLCLCALYITVPLFARYIGQNEAALSWYPYDTEANLVCLSAAEDEATVETLANRILAQNDTCSLAYYGKAMAADVRDDYETMISCQKEAIRRNYFDYDVYYEYAVMLYDGLVYADQENDADTWQLCAEELKKLPSYMENAKKKLSSLGKKIKDQPELEIQSDMAAILSLVEE